MIKGLALKIKTLREDNNMTQTELARKLNVSRACVSSWEIELSNPSTESIVDLANLFNVSSDYLLGINHNSCIDIAGLSNQDVSMLYNLAKRLSNK